MRANNLKSKDVLTTGDTAKILDLPRQTVLKYCVEGKIKANQHPITGTWKIKKSDLIDFMKHHGMQSDELEHTKKIKVLIVEDYEYSIDVITRYLKKISPDFEIDFSLNGYDALLKIGSDIPDIIILDYQMPELNGEEVLRSIRNNLKTCEIKIMAISAYPDAIEKMHKLSADICLGKPFTFEDFQEKMKRILGDGF